MPTRRSAVLGPFEALFFLPSGWLGATPCRRGATTRCRRPDVGEVFDSLLRGIGSLLSFFYGLIPSYGVAIILLTIAINILIFPLTLKQTRATRAMQKVQPEIRRIQKEYKEEPKKMQEELVKAQRAAGASPLGCLGPLIVQMPIWIALFQVLRSPDKFLPAGSPLLALIQSGQDHFLGLDLGETIASRVAASGILGAFGYLVVLGIMITSQYIQTWHAQPRNQVIDDPQQRATQTVTKIMPIFFGFISYNFQAGLVLYWTTSNIFRLLQQILIFRLEGRPETAVPKPAPPENETAPPKAKPNPPQQGRRKRRRN